MEGIAEISINEERIVEIEAGIAKFKEFGADKWPKCNRRYRKELKEHETLLAELNTKILSLELNWKRATSEIL